ncbi:MAG: hypothetical protein V5A43_02025 [Haloarculaceae archaeon]
MKPDAEDLRTNVTDDRGRIYLGSEYANTRVTITVVDVESDRPDAEKLPTAYQDASDSAETLAEACEGPATGAWTGLDE